MQKSGVTRIFLFNYFSIRDILISFFGMCSFTNYKFRTRMHGAGRDENSVDILYLCSIVKVRVPEK